MLSTMGSVRLNSSIQYARNTDNVLRSLLVQHPQVLSKLRHEIKDAIGVGPAAPEPTITQLKKLSYLSNVIKEDNPFSPKIEPFESTD